MARRASVEKRQEWAERLKRYRGSGQTVAAFCESESVSLASFYQWRRKLHDSAAPDAESRLPRLKPIRLSTTAPTTPVVTVRLAGGMTIEVGSDSEALAEVLDQVLTRHAAWQLSEAPSC